MIFVKSRFSRSFPCENLDLEVPSVAISIQTLIQNGSPRGSRSAKMDPHNVKLEANTPKMAIPRSQKRPAAAGVALQVSHNSKV